MSNSEYFDRIQKRIAQKKMRIFKDAFKQGFADGRVQCAPFLADLEAASRTIDRWKIDLLINHAETIIEEHLVRDPKSIVAMVLKLLKNIAEHTDVELTASPKDAQILRASLSEIAMGCSSARKVSITEDESFKRGSIIIKANKSIIDAHLSTELCQARDLVQNRIQAYHGSSH